jgi:hypothetical protein
MSKVDQSLEDALMYALSQVAAWRLARVGPVKSLVDVLGEKENMELHWSGNWLYISFSGTRKDLHEVWKLLRANGWIPPDTRPEASATSWVGLWTKDEVEPRVWVSFASTVCRREQIGTKMQEVPVYKVVCDDKAELNGDLSELL